MKLNQSTKSLVIAFALLGIVQVQAKPEMYVTENDSAPIGCIEATSLQEPQEGDGYEVVKQVYVPRKGYRNRKKQHHATRHIVKESNPVTMASAAKVIAYTAGVGALAFVTVGIFLIVGSLRVASMVG